MKLIIILFASCGLFLSGIFSSVYAHENLSLTVLDNPSLITLASPPSEEENSEKEDEKIDKDLSD